MKLDKILVIGPGSLTGSRFIELLADDVEVYGAGGSMDENTPKLKKFFQLDITDPQSVQDVFKEYPGKFVINFAGATAVDEIEKTRPADINNQEELNNNLAYKINVLGTRHVVDAAKLHEKFPIFISTGFVFDGENGPYTEESPVASDPQKVSWYAWTKMLGEKEVSKDEGGYIMLRPDYPFRSEYEGKMDFGRSFLKLYDEVTSGKRESFYPIFADQTLAPTFIDDFTPAVTTLIEKDATGTFHLTSPEITTPYDFCLEILKVARGVEDPASLVPKGNIVEFQEQHPELAKRPVHGGLKSDKIITTIGFTPTDWREGIKKAYGK